MLVVPSRRARRAVGRAELGLLPIDNAIAGTIREGYDVLAEYELDLLAEITWRMDHRLLGVAGATLAGLREIDSHPVVLAECGRFLGSLTDVRRVPVPDTGVAARDVAAEGNPARGAIASADAAQRYGLIELANTIADHPDNFTRFILFRAPDALGRRPSSSRPKTSAFARPRSRSRSPTRPARSAAASRCSARTG